MFIFVICLIKKALEALTTAMFSVFGRYTAEKMVKKAEAATV